MAEYYRRSAERHLQGVLLEEPEFLRPLVERVLQEMLEAEMTEHIGAAPYERAEKHTGQRNGSKPRALRQSTRYRYLLENFHIAWQLPEPPPDSVA